MKSGLRPSLRGLCTVGALFALALGLGQAVQADIVWTETYVGDGTTSGGSDSTEGLANATFVLSFTTDSGVYVKNASDFLVATASTGTLTISGASVAANNGTFDLSDDPSWTSGSMDAIVNEGGFTVGLDQFGTEPGIILPSGHFLWFPTAIFEGSTAVVSEGDIVDAADFGTVFSFELSSPRVVNGSNDTIWSQIHNQSSTLNISNASAIPEPSSLMLLCGAALGGVFVRRRKR